MVLFFFLFPHCRSHGLAAANPDSVGIVASTSMTITPLYTPILSSYFADFKYLRIFIQFSLLLIEPNST